VNTRTVGTQVFAKIAMNSSGFVVTWADDPTNTSTYDVYARRYDINGNALDSTEFRVNTVTTSSQSTPRVALSAQGDFVISWVSQNEDGSGNGVYAQRYTASGQPDGSEFRVNTTTAGDQTLPAIAMGLNKSFLVAWQDNGAGGPTGIFAQRYGIAGTRAIYGNLFNDANANGIAVPDADETGQEGFTVYIDSNNDGAWESGEPVTVTDAQGNYSFYGAAITAGNYLVREVPRPGWRQTSPVINSSTNNGANPAGVLSQFIVTGQTFGVARAAAIQINTGGPLQEGASITLQAAGLPTLLPSNVQVDWIVKQGTQTIAFAGSATTSVFTFTPADGGSYDVTLLLSANSVVTQTTSTLIVNNVAPTATSLINNGPVNESSPVTGSLLNPTDASSVDAASLHYSFALTQSGLIGTYALANNTNHFSFAFSDNGAYIVYGRVLDKDGGFTDYQTTVTVNDVAPTASSMSNSGPVNEGSLATVSLTSPTDISSVDAASLHYSFALTQGGLISAYSAASAVNNGTFAFPDNGAYTVYGRVIDKDGGFTDYQTTVTVNNVAPTATNLTNSGLGGEGNLVTVSLASPTDVSSVDAASLHYSFALTQSGLGNAYATASATNIGTFTFLDSGAYTVYGRVIDKDGAFNDYQTTITVNNVAPTAGISVPSSPIRGHLQSFILTSSDPSMIDQNAGFTYHINWGDGSAIQTVNGLSGTLVSHVFTSVGSRTISVTATDQDGGISAGSNLNVAVTATQLRANSQSPTIVDLVWAGTSAGDHVRFEQVNPTTIRIITLEENGSTTNFVETISGVTGRVLASGVGGDDTLDASGLISTKATLDGGVGNDTLFGGAAGDVLIGGSNTYAINLDRNVIVAGNGDNTIYGNAPTAQRGAIGGDNLILGGTGHDVIYGNFGSNPTGDGGEGGQNLIIGGGGGDTIYASQFADGAEGGHGSILVGGSTSLGPAALQSVLSEWTSTHTLQDKIANILGFGAANRLNGDNYLTPGGTLSNDLAVDEIFSDNHGQSNWLLVTLAQDVSKRVKAKDTTTDIP
jgi:hypothetical protein